MAIYKIDNLSVPVALGLEWHLLPGTTSESKEVTAIAKQQGIYFGARVTNEKTSHTVLGLSSDRKSGVACGAAWLAKTAVASNSSLVLIESLENGLIWMCAIRAGLPVQDLDIVVPETQLHQRLPEFLEGTQDPKIFSTIENFEGYGYANVSPQSFAELVADTKPEMIRRQAGVPPALVGFAFALVAGVGIWYGATSYLSAEAARAGAAMSAEAARKAAKQAEEAARLAAEAHRAQGVEMISDAVLRRPAISSAVSSVFTAIEHMPINLAGWELSKVSCAIKRCDFEWARTKTSTVLDFVRAAESNGFQITNAAGDLATTTASLEWAARDGGVDLLQEEGVFRLVLESQLQRMATIGVTYQLPSTESVEKYLASAAGSAKAQKPLLPGAAAVEAPAKSMRLPWHVGKATLNGKNLFVLRGVPDYLENDSIAIQKVAIDMKANTWNLEINYATR